MDRYDENETISIDRKYHSIPSVSILRRMCPSMIISGPNMLPMFIFLSTRHCAWSAYLSAQLRTTVSPNSSHVFSLSFLNGKYNQYVGMYTYIYIYISLQLSTQSTYQYIKTRKPQSSHNYHRNVIMRISSSS